jgi:hypothetical protein
MNKVRLVGGVVSALGALPFLFGSLMKFKGGPELSQGLAHMGLPESLRLPIAVLELTCALLYLIPPTSALGAILLTGFLGGAMLTHLRIGEPVYIHVVLGILVWLGLYLRDARLKALIPLRTREAPLS